ncbi:phosphotransferase family protein [Mycolicibacterium austroafricanum]|uniref:phosphotransferase family protein n=1 Tax=Mycolicibacterium austroafricanum TaxID=39687 RepID=UPI001CA35295|nr:phosphotransferase family protein [Mycolicibacterium austroafricanum]QZT58623.1 phosphotransferase family protein [Mycolicibacterium austroafricanum]
MALQNTIDTPQVRARLTDWLSGKFADRSGLAVTNFVVPSSAGLSNETVLFDVEWDGGRHSQPMVARVAPAGPGVFPSYDLNKEATVLRALGGHTAVAVPRVHFFEHSPTVFGAPFIVMERVAGQVPSDDPPFTAGGWVLDLSSDERAAMWDNAISTIAQIHNADWRGLGLEALDPAPGGDNLTAHIGYWRNFFDWAAEGEANPTIEHALDWLERNRPAEAGRKVLNWGDARVGNIIFSDSGQVAAVLDWEMVTVASPELDLGWWFFLERHHTEGIGLPMPTGFPDRAQTVARYQELTGHRVENLDYYEVFAGARLSIVMVRAAHMMIAAGLLPPDAPMALSNPASQLLAKLLDLPAPTGETTTFIGNR